MAVYLMDTNILLRFANTEAEEHGRVDRALDTLLERQDDVVLVPQVLYEFWAVATRPVQNNGLGWSVAKTRDEFGPLRQRFDLLSDAPELFDTWLELVTSHDVKGKQVHDARLVAVMQTHKLNRLLTLNVKEFERYPVHPDDVNEPEPSSPH